jgi:carbon monoxide dehydrogenase subunit G
VIIDDGFEVDAPVERVWPVLCDVPRVARCIPNAQITEIVDERTYKAKVSIKVGPVAVSYGATIVVESLDEATHTASLSVQGNELRGRGGVKAKVVSRAEAAGENRTRVSLHTDAQISGIIATVGGRLIEGVAKKTVAEFAANLNELL